MSTRDLMRRIGRGGEAGGQWAQCIGGGQAQCEKGDEERRGELQYHGVQKGEVGVGDGVEGTGGDIAVGC